MLIKKSASYVSYHTLSALAIALLAYTSTSALLPSAAMAEEPAQKRIAAENLTGNKEYEAIAKAVDKYIEGGRKGSSEIMKNAFQPGANIFGHQNGEPVGGPIQLLYDLVDGKAAAGEIPYTIVDLNVVEKIAMVRVDIDNWAGTRYSDMFTMIKAADEWKIVSKVSHKY